MIDTDGHTTIVVQTLPKPDAARQSLIEEALLNPPEVWYTTGPSTSKIDGKHLLIIAAVVAGVVLLFRRG